MLDYVLDLWLKPRNMTITMKPKLAVVDCLASVKLKSKCFWHNRNYSPCEKQLIVLRVLLFVSFFFTFFFYDSHSKLFKCLIFLGDSMKMAKKYCLCSQIGFEQQMSFSFLKNDVYVLFTKCQNSEQTSERNHSS